MTHGEAAAEQVINWRRAGLLPGECLQAMGRRSPASADWMLVANVVARESMRLAAVLARSAVR